MKTYRFTIFLRGIDVMTDDIAETLYEAGCDDSSPGSGCGEAYVAFDREAKSLESAVASAANDVRTAGFHIAEVRIDESDLTELTVS